MTLYRALQPLLLGIYASLSVILKHVPVLNRKTEKFRKTFEIRYVQGRPAFFGIDRAVFVESRPVWIHAASGEFEYAKPIVRELAKAGRPVLVTYFSPTFAENVRRFPGVSASCPLPLDSRDELDQFLDYFNPSALLIARTDAWPNTVLATRSRSIPCLLFSTTFHDGSKRMQGPGRQITIDTLKLIDQIQCVSIDDRVVLESIGLKNVETCGDTRYDQVLERLKTSKQLPEVLKGASENRAFVAGSVWSEDLIPLLFASTRTYRDSPHTLFIVPHEINESFLNEIESKAKQFEIASTEIIRFSELVNLQDEQARGRRFRVIIVDAVGFLAELYQLGEIAFVGGSFRKTVHSVMEPLAAGALTIVGPLHTNNREALEFQKVKTDRSVSYVTAVRDEAEFASVLSSLWKASESQDLKNQIQAAVAKRGGATAFVMRWLDLQV